MRKLAEYILDISMLSDGDKFVRVMSNKEKPVTNAVGKYICNCLKKRNSIILVNSQST